MKRILLCSAAALLLMAGSAAASNVMIVSQISTGANYVSISQDGVCNCATMSQVGGFNYMWIYQSAPLSLGFGSQQGYINGASVIQVGQ